MTPPLPRTPRQAIPRTVTTPVILDDRTFSIVHPDESDRLFDHPLVKEAFAGDDYLPYWADLWPASRMLAKAVLREPWAPGLHAIEIGCGLGLPGIAALACGMRVTFTDYDATALDFAAENARRNRFTDFTLLPLDWRHPPEGLQAPVLLASDLLYELRNVVPLVELMKQMLAPGGLCLLTDQDRVPSHLLRETLLAEGFAFTTKVMHAGEPGGRRARGTLYRITASTP